MNIDRDSRPPPGVPITPNQFQQGRNVPIRELTKEEVQVLKDCQVESTYLAGIPFALGMHFYFSHREKVGIFQGVPPPGALNPQNPLNPILRVPFVRSGLRFLLNVFLGRLLYAPICYSRLKTAVEKNNQMMMNQEQGGLIGTEENISGADISNFQGSLNLDLDGPESNFSHLSVDFDPNVSDTLILEDEDKPKTAAPPQTTYETLRKINRYGLKGQNPQSAPVVDNYQGPVQQKPETPPRRLVKNKYGDTME